MKRVLVVGDIIPLRDWLEYLQATDDGVAPIVVEGDVLEQPVPLGEVAQILEKMGILDRLVEVFPVTGKAYVVPSGPLFLVRYDV